MLAREKNNSLMNGNIGKIQSIDLYFDKKINLISLLIRVKIFRSNMLFNLFLRIK